MVLPLYVFTGPESGEKKNAVESIKKALQKSAGAIEDYTLYASESKMADVMRHLINESLFAAARFVVFRNAELIKDKNDIELLIAWAREAQNAQSLSTLILESDENSINKQLENLAPKENRRIFWEMFENKKEEWLRNYFSKAGYRIESGAIDTILGMIENNTESLAAECSRFFLCFEKDHVITPDDAELLLFHNREESAFSLFAALTRADLPPQERLENALDILQKLRGTKKSTPFDILPPLAFCFRKISDWREFTAKNSAPSPLDYKIAGFSAKIAQNQYRSAALLWNESQTAACIALLAWVESETRGGGLPAESHDVLLQMMLYSLVLKKGAPIEASAFAF